MGKKISLAVRSERTVRIKVSRYSDPYCFALQLFDIYIYIYVSFKQKINGKEKKRGERKQKREGKKKLRELKYWENGRVVVSAASIFCFIKGNHVAAATLAKRYVQSIPPESRKKRKINGHY